MSPYRFDFYTEENDYFRKKKYKLQGVNAYTCNNNKWNLRNNSLR